MRTYQLNVDGRDYMVEVDDLTASPVTVRVNGRTFLVVVSEPNTFARGEGAQKATQVATMGQKATEVATTGRTRELDIDIDSYVPVVPTTFVEGAPDFEPEASPVTRHPSAVTHSVTSPMPGKIMDVAVRAGDRVQRGDTLCNLEAMKMKTPIRSTADGVVAQVLVSEGQNVRYGDVLFALHAESDALIRRVP